MNLNPARIALAAALAAPALYGCSCVSYATTCERLRNADVAFIGTVVVGTEIDPRPGWGVRPATLRVETVVRGVESGVGEIQVDPSLQTSCYIRMVEAQRWLILGRRVDGLVRTGGCSGSYIITPGDRTTLRSVTSYISGPNFLFGHVRRYLGWDSKWRTDNLLAGVEVTLRGDAGNWSSKTDANGYFHAEGLPPGKYRFQAPVAGLSMEETEDVAELRAGGALSPLVTIPASGCVEIPAMMRPDQGIRGTVRSADGAPLPGIAVEACQVGTDGNLEKRPERRTVTGPLGAYSLPRLESGLYAVGVNTDYGRDSQPYRMTFHPSAHSARDAIHIPIEGKTVEGVDIFLDSPRRLVETAVLVLDSNGRPAERAQVTVAREDKGELVEDMRHWSSRVTNKDGLLRISLFEGEEYVLSAAELSPSPEEGKANWSESGPVRAVVSGNTPVVVTLNKSSRTIVWPLVVNPKTIGPK